MRLSRAADRMLTECTLTCCWLCETRSRRQVSPSALGIDALRVLGAPINVAPSGHLDDLCVQAVSSLLEVRRARPTLGVHPQTIPFAGRTGGHTCTPASTRSPTSRVVTQKAHHEGAHPCGCDLYRIDASPRQPLVDECSLV